MTYAGVPVEELLERHGRGLVLLQPYFQARQDGADFLTAWSRTAENGLLSGQERVLLQGFGEGFGATDLQGQLSHCSLYQELTRKELDTAEKQYSEKGKLYRMLGICIGAMVALVLL